MFDAVFQRFAGFQGGAAVAVGGVSDVIKVGLHGWREAVYVVHDDDGARA